MPSLNRWQGLGHLTRDPELQYTQSGVARTKFGMAVNSRSGDDDDTLFLNITAWRGTAEACDEYLEKGSPVYVEGPLKISQYTDSEDIDRKWVEVTARNVQFLSSPGANEEESEPESENDDEVPY